MRCFVAVELDPALKIELLRWIESRRRKTSDTRWCTVDQLHLTLRFLGDVPDERLPALCAAVDAASSGIAPFDIRLGRLGVFPPRGSPRVFWREIVDASGAAAAWVAAAEPALLELGFPPEQRKFTPHVTLARSKGNAGSREIAVVAAEAAQPCSIVQRVTALTLFESHLEPTGATYRAVHHVKLSG